MYNILQKIEKGYKKFKANMIEDEEEFLKHFTNRYNKVQAIIRELKMKTAVNMRSIKAGEMPWSPKFKVLKNYY